MVDKVILYQYSGWWWRCPECDYVNDDECWTDTKVTCEECGEEYESEEE